MGVAGLALAALVVLVLLSVGGYFLFVKASPEKTLIGRWQLDAQAQNQNDANPMINAMTAKMTTMEFEAGGTLRAADSGMTFIRQWKHVKTEGKIVTVEIFGGGIPNTVLATVTIIDNDHIRYQTPTLPGHNLYLKRMR